MGCATLGLASYLWMSKTRWLSQNSGFVFVLNSSHQAAPKSSDCRTDRISPRLRLSIPHQDYMRSFWLLACHPLWLCLSGLVSGLNIANALCGKDRSWRPEKWPVDELTYLLIFVTQCSTYIPWLQRPDIDRGKKNGNRRPRHAESEWATARPRFSILLGFRSESR